MLKISNINTPMIISPETNSVATETHFDQSKTAQPFVNTGNASLPANLSVSTNRLYKKLVALLCIKARYTFLITS